MLAARCTIESPVGPLTITAEDDKITARRLRPWRRELGCGLINAISDVQTKAYRNVLRTAGCRKLIFNHALTWLMSTPPSPNGGLLAEGRAPAHRILRRHAPRVHAPARAVGHVLPPQGVGGDAGDPLRPDPQLRRPRPRARQAPLAPSAAPAGPTRFPSSSPATGSSARAARSAGSPAARAVIPKRQLLALERALLPQLSV